MAKEVIMEEKVIDFETLSDVCKYRNIKNGCDEDDNISGKCDCSECPVCYEYRKDLKTLERFRLIDISKCCDNLTI